MSMVMNELADHYKGVRQRMTDAANQHRLDKIAEARAKAEADARAAAELAERNKHTTKQQIERVKRQWEDQIAITKQQLALRKRDWIKITNEIIDAREISWRELAERNKHTTKQQIERVKRQWEDQIAITKQQLALRKRDWIKITNEIIDAREISWRELVSPNRNYRLVAARHHVWYAIRLELKLSYPQIAAKFGRDHTTVMHGCQQHAKRIGVTLDQPKKSPSYSGRDTGHHHAERNGLRRPKAVVQARLTVREHIAWQDGHSL
jgi:aspartate carbamoyltransferase regulatory subunit